MDGCGRIGAKIPGGTLEKCHCNGKNMDDSHKIIALELPEIPEDASEMTNLLENLFRCKSQAEWTETFRGARVRKKDFIKLAFFRQRCLCDASAGHGQRIGPF